MIEPTKSALDLRWVLIGAWFVLTCLGMAGLWSYEMTPGGAQGSPPLWPADSRVPRAAGRYALVLAVHPRCPCSRASLGELDRLMSRLQGRLSVFVLFYRPAGFASGWEKTDLWRSAAAIPGVTPLADDDAVEARRFGALTSGHTLLYGPDGRLLFSGGITSSRGHFGDNAGQDAVYSLARGKQAKIRQTPVYGCSLAARRTR